MSVRERFARRGRLSPAARPKRASAPAPVSEVGGGSAIEEHVGGKGKKGEGRAVREGEAK